VSHRLNYKLPIIIGWVVFRCKFQWGVSQVDCSWILVMP
jgi:hypothetical protein